MLNLIQTWKAQVLISSQFKDT